MSKRRNHISIEADAIRKKTILQFFAAIVLWPAVTVLAAFLGFVVCGTITWQPDSMIYQLLTTVKTYFEFVCVGVVLIGWVVIAIHFLSKPFLYLEEIIDASEQLANTTEEAISLPDSMKNVQDRFNLLRERSNRNALAAKEAEQRKNDLVVYLAHDLKTPIASIIGYLTLLRDEKQISQELHDRYVRTVLDNAERLDDLINEFFEITRFNLSHITLEYSEIDLIRLLEQLTAEFHPLLAEKDLTCTLKVPSRIALRCDADKMERVFDNLLRNAVSYSFPGTEIHIHAEVQESRAVLTFVNHGSTIPQEKLDRIFEQFYRLDSARSTRTGGSGLGLAIAKQIIELHHGSITAQSEQDTISFTVVIPLQVS